MGFDCWECCTYLYFVTIAQSSFLGLVSYIPRLLSFLLCLDISIYLWVCVCDCGAEWKTLEISSAVVRVFLLIEFQVFIFLKQGLLLFFLRVLHLLSCFVLTLLRWRRDGKRLLSVTFHYLRLLVALFFWLTHIVVHLPSLHHTRFFSFHWQQVIIQ